MIQWLLCMQWHTHFFSCRFLKVKDAHQVTQCLHCNELLTASVNCTEALPLLSSEGLKTRVCGQCE